MNRFRSERRQYERSKIDLPVQYSMVLNQRDSLSYQENGLVARTSDISEGGIALVVNERVSAETELVIRFKRHDHDLLQSGDLDPYISVSGKISHVASLGACRFKIGVCFGAVTEEIRSKFFDIVCLSASSIY